MHTRIYLLSDVLATMAVSTDINRGSELARTERDNLNGIKLARARAEIITNGGNVDLDGTELV